MVSAYICIQKNKIYIKNEKTCIEKSAKQIMFRTNTKFFTCLTEKLIVHNKKCAG